MVSAKSVLFVLLAMLVAATALRRESRGQLSQLSSAGGGSGGVFSKFEKFYNIHKRGPKPRKTPNHSCMVESTNMLTHGIKAPWLKCCNLGNHWGKSRYCKDDENPEASSQ